MAIIVRKAKKMKRKVLIGMLASMGSLAIVGSGFASWYFGADPLVTQSKSVNSHVTNLVEGIGTLTDDNASQSLYIVLDQGGYANKSDVSKGISFVDAGKSTLSDSNFGTPVNALSATYTVSVKEVNDLVNAGVTSATFTAGISLSTSAKTYLDFATNYENSIKGGNKLWASISNGELIYMATVTFTKDTAVNQKFEFPTSTKDGTNDMLVYKKKPTTDAEYDEMKSDLNGEEILSVNYHLAVAAS